MTRALTIAFVSVVLVLISSESVHAHKVIASLFAAGDDIEGEIGFSNGDVAAGVTVQVMDGEGALLAEIVTDGDGFFTYRPDVVGVHRFFSNLGAGHIAEVEFDVMAVPLSQAALGDLTYSNVMDPHQSALRDGEGVSVEGLNAEQLRQLIGSIVRDEVRPLRREIAAYKEKNDLQVILGAIGYILGLFGLGFYLLARNKLKQAER